MAEHLEAPKSTEGMTYIYKYFMNLTKTYLLDYFQRSTYLGTFAIYFR